jgi:hypothetical protein
MRTYISQFEYKGEAVDLLYASGQISYVFERKGKRYGNAVKAQGKGIRDIMNATAALVINYVATLEEVEKNDK